MERLKITQEMIDTTYGDFLGNEHILRFISEGSINDMAYSYSASDALKLYENSTKAYAKLEYIYDRLKDGIPLNFKPDSINGRTVYKTPGTHLNCAFHTFIKMGKPEWDWPTIESKAKGMRKTLVREGWLKNMRC